MSSSVELFLNFAWFGLALASVLLWLRCGRRDERRWYLPLVALAMLVVLLFPVISVSDDLWAVQNPAETDSWVRRNLDHATAPMLLLFTALPAAIFAGLWFSHLRAPLPQLRARVPFRPWIGASLWNRPPPLG